MDLISLTRALDGHTKSSGGYNITDLRRYARLPYSDRQDCLDKIVLGLTPEDTMSVQALQFQERERRRQAHSADMAERRKLIDRAHNRYLLSVQADSRAAKQLSELAVKRADRRKRELVAYQEERPDEDHVENLIQENIYKNDRINVLIKEAKEKLLRYKTSNRRPGSYDHYSYIPAPEFDQETDQDPDLMWTSYKDLDQENEQEGPVNVEQQEEDIKHLREKIKRLYKKIVK